MMRSLLLLLLLALSYGAIAEPLKIATLSLPPFAYMENGKVRGFAVDIVVEAMDRLKLEHKIVIQPWARSLHDMKVGRIDALFPMFNTSDRQPYTNYPSLPIVYENKVMFIHADAPILFEGDFSSLGEYRICRVRGYSSGQAFDNAEINGELPNVELVNSSLQNLQKMLRHRCQILVDNQSTILHLLKHLGYEQDQLRVLHYLEQVPSFVGFSKFGQGKDLPARLAAEIEQMRASGELQKIIQHYLGKGAQNWPQQPQPPTL